MSAQVIFGVLAAVLAAPVLASAVYLAILAVGALIRDAPAVNNSAANSLRVAVVIPAHDEAELIGRCLDSLRQQTYPLSLVRVVVVADNCSDATEQIALAAGVEVMARDDIAHPGKGEALRWAFDRILAEDPSLDAVLVVDGDSVCAPDFLAAMVMRAESGADVVQADYRVLEEPGSRSALRAAAFLLFHRGRFLGRAALGWGCSLVGNGMLFRRQVLERVPWDAMTGAEDLEFTVTLRLHGIVPRFAPDARIAGPAPTAGRAGKVQRLRWEGGRFHVIRTGLPRLLGAAIRRRDMSILDAAIELAVVPLGLLVLASLLGASAAATGALVRVLPWWATIPWLASLAGIAVYVLGGLRAAGAPSQTYRALLGAPWFLLLKLATYARLARGLKADRWERTPRPPAQPGAPSDRVDVGGVPIDVVSRAEAASRVSDAVERGTFLQVCTVNLQFLGTARRNGEVRELFGRSGLNVADGAPVAWAARRLGARLPERVTGADLVPQILADAAPQGRRVFLLGGRDAVAEQAGSVLQDRYPGLVVAGTYEPPVTAVDAIATDEIITVLEAARADILLVGLGHPKQDLWIHRNRERLPVSVAIGVGCTLELLANRRRRAPEWMQTHGVEWLYRLVREPRRLLWRYVTCATQLAFVLVPLVVAHQLRGSAQNVPEATPVVELRGMPAPIPHALAETPAEV